MFPYFVSTYREEDIKYLRFVKDVTDDIITRGICSDRVINNCFEHHIALNRGRLDELKMRNLLDKLRKDIQIHGNSQIK